MSRPQHTPTGIHSRAEQRLIRSFAHNYFYRVGWSLLYNRQSPWGLMQKLLSRRSALFGILTCSRAAEGNVCDHFDSANPPGVEGFDCEVRTVGDRTHSLYWKGSGSGPAVFVLHEIPGLYRADIDLARRIEKQGFTVFVPLFFGRPGECHPKRNLLTKPLNPGSEFSYWLPSTPRAARWLEP
jgi:Dienelactone hydrolase family